MKYIQGFDLITQDVNGIVSPLANTTITVYNETNSTSLTSITSDAHGFVPNFQRAVNTGDIIRLTVSGYSNVLRRIAQDNIDQLADEKIAFLVQSDYTPFVVESVVGEVFMQNLTDGTAPVYLGKAKVGQTLEIPFKFDKDADVKFYLNSADENGNKVFFAISEMVNQTLQIRLESVPTIGQLSTATNTSISIGVSNYSDLARFRKIQVCDVNTFTGGTLSEDVQNAVDYTNNKLPVNFTLTRASSPSSATKYVRIAHSTNGTIYTAYSNVLTVTFTDILGDGGSSGGFNPDPTFEYAV